MKMIRLWLDHPRVGCGWRNYLVITEGRKWAKLMTTATAETISVPVDILKTGVDVPFKKTRAARRLREVAKTYGVETVALKEALSDLR